MRSGGPPRRLAEEMAAADELARVEVRLRRGSIEQLDAYALHRGISRADAIREAVTWLIARESVWQARRERQRIAEQADAHLQAAIRSANPWQREDST